MFCDAYELALLDRKRLVSEIIERLEALVDFIQEQAAQGDATFQEHLVQGHHRLYLADVDDLHHRREAITQGLL